LAGVGGSAAWDEGVSEGEDEDETEAGDGSEGGSEAYVTADEGYDADVEVLEVCGTGVTNRVGVGDVGEESSSSIATTTALVTPVPVISSILNPVRVPHNIAHPSLCLLAVELLVHLNRRLVQWMRRTEVAYGKVTDVNEHGWCRDTQMVCASCLK
jgi:hypothetical protein